MREASTGRSYRRSRRKKRGCGGNGCFWFVIVLAVIIAAVFFGVRYYYNSDLSQKIKRTQYPLKYQHFVEEYSEKNGLDKNIVYAVIRTESRFDIYAVSSVGAKGLMQLTEETGSDCAKALGILKYNKDMLFDPETNIRLGCFYLKTLKEKYGNSMNTALAAFNGGPANVDKWLKDPKYSSDGKTLTDIPYSETEGYVNKVNKAAEMYKSLY